MTCLLTSWPASPPWSLHGSSLPGASALPLLLAEKVPGVPSSDFPASLKVGSSGITVTLTCVSFLSSLRLLCSDRIL